MFAIEIERERNLYNWYGCYEAPEKKVIDTKNVKKKEISNVVTLTKVKQSMLHNVIKTMTKKSKHGTEWVVKPEMVVMMIIGAEIELGIKDKKEEDAAALMIKGIKGISLKKRLTDGETEDSNWRSVVIKQAEIRRLTLNRKIKLVLIETLAYKRRIPDYISRLIPIFERHGCLHVINTIAGRVPVDDVYFVNLFKNRVIMRVETDTAVVVDPDRTVVTVLAETVGERYKIEGIMLGLGVTLDYVLGTRLYFSDGMIVQSYAPVSEFEEDVGASFRSMFQRMVAICIADQSSVGRGGLSLLIKAVPSPKIVPSITSLMIYKKIDFEIMKLPKERKRVNVIMIGEKGSGKSTSSKLMAAAIKLRYGTEVDIVSSDAYGRWLLYLCLKYSIAQPEMLSDDVQLQELDLISYEMYTSQDADNGASWYEGYAEQILVMAGITELEQYSRLSMRKKNDLISSMIRVITPRLRTKSPLSVSSFYSRIEGVMQRDVCIYECHITEESTQMARSDIIFRLKPFADPRINIMGRSEINETSVCTELLLYDTYVELIGFVNPSVYMSDLLHQILLPVGEKY